jgi:hypothetical protein
MTQYPSILILMYLKEIIFCVSCEPQMSVLKISKTLTPILEASFGILYVTMPIYIVTIIWLINKLQKINICSSTWPIFRIENYLESTKTEAAIHT